MPTTVFFIFHLHRYWLHFDVKINRLKHPRFLLDQLKNFEFSVLFKILEICQICDLFPLRYFEIEALRSSAPKKCLPYQTRILFDFLLSTIILIYFDHQISEKQRMYPPQTVCKSAIFSNTDFCPC